MWPVMRTQYSIAIVSWETEPMCLARDHKAKWHPYISTTRETHHCIFHASKALIHGGACQGLARQSLDMPMLLNQNRGSRQQSKIRRAPLAWGWEHGL